MFYICSNLQRGLSYDLASVRRSTYSKKLNKLEDYLKAYLKVFKNKDWVHTIYIDAFAGTGEVPTAAADPSLPLDDDGKAFIVGSARRALSLESSFSEYVFIEKTRMKARELERLKTEYPEKAGRITIVNEDANSALQSICAKRDWRKCRAVVFLDPFGNQVEWKTIEAIAKTKSVDLWYFPSPLVWAFIARSAAKRSSIPTRKSH